MKLTPREESACALVAFLETVQAQPREESQMVKDYLHSQASLVRYENPSVGIRACSLNTLKKSCSVVPGGFMALDAARRRALAALDNIREAESSDEGASKRTLQARVKKLRQLLQASTEDLLLLTRLLERSLRHGRQYAADSRNASLIERCAREQAEVRDMLTLRQVADSHLHVLGESR